jgi:hypothetical protein
MPLIKSTSGQAFGHNVGAEMAAGKPQRQAVAIAYSVKREAEHHSGHSARRSDHYHKHIVAAQKVTRGRNRMTRAAGQMRNDEDDTTSQPGAYNG